jgi:hypothetical protein
MGFPEPTFIAAHGVLQLPNPAPRDPARDETLIAEVRGEFPNILNRQLLPPEAAPGVPHLVMSSTSSQLAISAMQADFEVRFYGDYVDDLARGLEYVERKIETILRGFKAVDLTPSMVGLIATLHFSFKGLDEQPTTHILRTHLRPEINPDEVQDAHVKVALKVQDTYFVNLTLSNYESRALERPVFPGLSFLRIRPWEGRLDDLGVELGIDINNNLQARTRQEDPEVDAQDIQAVTGMLREIATTVGPRFAEVGEVSAADLAVSAS